MQKKRIAMIVNSIAYSGLEKVVTEIMLDLQSQFEFIYVTQNGPIVERLQELKLNYYLVDKINKRNINHFIKTWHPDLIQAQDYTASTIVSLCGFKPYVCHLHHNAPWIRGINKNSLAFLFFGLKTNKILTVSNSIREEFVFNKLLKNKFETVGNPISIKEVQSQVSEKHTKQYDICCTGRIEQPKNPLRFLKIVDELKKQIPNIKVCWIGDGSMLEDCQHYVKEHNLQNNVEFVGYRKNPFELMNQSRVFMLTSDWEGFGLAAFEALSLGLPCYVSKVGGLPDIINDSCGKLCQTDDDFVKGITSILSSKDEYVVKSEAAIQRAKELDNREKYIAKMAETYKELIDRYAK